MDTTWFGPVVWVRITEQNDRMMWSHLGMHAREYPGTNAKDLIARRGIYFRGQDEDT